MSDDVQESYPHCVHGNANRTANRTDDDEGPRPSQGRQQNLTRTRAKTLSHHRIPDADPISYAVRTTMRLELEPSLPARAITPRNYTTGVNATRRVDRNHNGRGATPRAFATRMRSRCEY